MGRGEHHAPHVIVLAGGLEGGDQVGEQLGRQRIARVGLVEADRGDVLIDVIQQRLELGQCVS
jgi:hypothetical protein